MSTITQSIDVQVPVNTAYNQWTQFEDFPHFMEGVESIKQIDDTRTLWKISIGGLKREFETEITEQVPDRAVAWKSVGGTDHAGAVSFQPIDDANTRVTLRIDTAPEGLVEKLGDKLGLVEHRTKGDLERFKTFIEERGTSTGAWRGEVHGNEVTDTNE